VRNVGREGRNSNAVTALPCRAAAMKNIKNKNKKILK
jgi:hypothetical protein